jgi:peroxiredoxin
MSRRNTYLAGGAAIAAGVALIVIALVATSGDGGSGSTTTAPRQPAAADQDQSAAGGEGDAQPGSESPAQGRSISGELDRRGTVRAPALELEVIDEGVPPAQARAPLEDAVADGSLSLAKLRDSPVVLYVWAPDCDPCRADARLVETTWQRWGRRGVAVLGVTVDGSAQEALQFARRYDLTFPLLDDDGGRVAEAYGVTSLPEAFFISRSGDVVGHIAGSPSVRQMELGAAAARTGRAFGNEQGGSRVPRG